MSSRGGAAGFALEMVQPDAPLLGERHIVGQCPMYGSVMLNRCRECPNFHGVIDTGNLGPNQRYRVSCHAATQRPLRVSHGSPEFFVNCPLVNHKRNVKDCDDCPQFRGISRVPRPGWFRQATDRMFGTGVPCVGCAHPGTRRIEELV